MIAADSDDDAQRQFLEVSRRRISRFLQVPRQLTDDEADELLASPQGRPIAHMMHYTAAGGSDHVQSYLEKFAEEADADEFMTVHPSPSIAARLRSIDILADVFRRSWR